MYAQELVVKCYSLWGGMARQNGAKILLTTPEAAEYLKLLGIQISHNWLRLMRARGGITCGGVVGPEYIKGADGRVQYSVSALRAYADKKKKAA